MGCAQSTRPATNSPPQSIEKLKMENGYVKGEAYIGSRRSTGQRQESNRPMIRTESSRKGNGNRVANGRPSLGNKEIVKEGNMNAMEGERKSRSSSGQRVDSTNKASEDEELVDGWPKWLIDNIPRDVLKKFVPKSADSYIKIDKVGQGTYSNVYKARDKDTGMILALKKVRFDTSEPESVKFMAREIMILQRLDHPNIVKLEGLATSRMQYSLYLVFDFMHSDLARIISRPDERLTEPQIKCYMQQLLSGLQHCHERGILHRDIKGSNLLIDKNGMLKIADFGLANFFNPEKRRPLTSRVVTLWYRAPELLLGCTDYGTGIDLWSAGCLLAEMLAGRPIMPGRTEVEQLHRIFKLCGSPSDDYYKKYKLSPAFKSSQQTYKSTFGEAFRNFPASSLGLLNTLLAIDPANRGSAGSALRDQFFHTSPLACGLSGLPVIHVEDDDQDWINDRRKHRTSKGRRRSKSHREQSKRNIASANQNADGEGYNQKNVETSVFGIEIGSSTTSTSSTSARPNGKEESPRRLHPTPDDPPNHGMSSSTDAHPQATKNIKNRPPMPNMKRYTITNKYIVNPDVTNRLDLVQRSASTREFGSLENKRLLAIDP